MKIVYNHYPRILDWICCFFNIRKYLIQHPAQVKNTLYCICVHYLVFAQCPRTGSFLLHKSNSHCLFSNWYHSCSPNLQRKILSQDNLQIFNTTILSPLNSLFSKLKNSQFMAGFIHPSPS